MVRPRIGNSETYGIYRNEIYQLSTKSKIDNLYDGTAKWGYDISCNLGSLNIVNVMENKDIKNAVKLGVSALNVVVNDTNIDSVPTVANGNRNIRSIGLGVMNLHGYLAKNKIFYESREARDFANTFFATMRFYAIQRSMEISRDMKITFSDFEKSEYAKGEKGNVFPKYLKRDYKPVTDKVSKLFEGIELPTKEDWKQLMQDVQQYGMANGYLMAIAPKLWASYQKRYVEITLNAGNSYHIMVRTISREVS